MQEQATTMDERRATGPLTAERFGQLAGGIIAQIESVIDGKPHASRAALTCLLAEGHLLIEDVPGVGKTMLARALAASIAGDVKRIQFTPDLLPSDVTGVSVFDPSTREFAFTPGAVFANIVIADEINRSSPKTQSALLEAMEERQVSVDGRSRALPHPFLAVATQNPMEMEGTYALPEAQRDRFLMRISMGYPDPEAERRMLRERENGDPLAAQRAVADIAEVRRMIAFVRAVHVSPAIEEYAVALAVATRESAELRLGASPRATLALVRAAKANAALAGRAYVIPDDVAALLQPVLAHRLIPARAVSARGADAVPELLGRLAATVRVPIVTG